MVEIVKPMESIEEFIRARFGIEIPLVMGFDSSQMAIIVDEDVPIEVRDKLKEIYTKFTNFLYNIWATIEDMSDTEVSNYYLSRCSAKDFTEAINEHGFGYARALMASSVAKAIKISISLEGDEEEE